MTATVSGTEDGTPTYARPLVRTPLPDRPGLLGSLETPPVPVPGAYFDLEAVHRVIRAFRAFKHSKGRKFNGKAFELSEWQVVEIVAPVFGWKNADGTRVIRTVYIELPRKQGKSAIASGLALILLCADGEPGAEVYAGAGSIDQAKRVFDEARNMALAAPGLRKRLRILRKSIEYPKTSSVFTVLSSTGALAHGLNVSGAVLDELHVYKRRDLVDAIETGTGFRDQPLVIFITTADEGDDTTVYFEKHQLTRNLAAGVMTDPTFYGVIWAAEESDDPFAESTWEKAMPGLDVTVTRDFLRSEATKAKSSPALFARFCQLYLNLRVRATTRWLDLAAWRRSSGATGTDHDPAALLARLKGARAWGGLDLSAVSDFTCYALVVEDPLDTSVLHILPTFYLPEDSIEQLEQRLRVPLREWAEQGHLTITEGNAVDYGVVERDIIDSGTYFDLQTMSYDRLFAGQMVQHLMAAGVDVAPVSQTFVGLSPASKELERLTLLKQLQHHDHPVLYWHAGCVEVARDAHDNIKPVKPDRNKSVNRIDGIAAEVMALDGWVRREPAKQSTIYSR